MDVVVCYGFAIGGRVDGCHVISVVSICMYKTALDRSVGGTDIALVNINTHCAYIRTVSGIAICVIGYLLALIAGVVCLGL